MSAGVSGQGEVRRCFQEEKSAFSVFGFLLRGCHQNYSTLPRFISRRLLVSAHHSARQNTHEIRLNLMAAPNQKIKKPKWRICCVGKYNQSAKQTKKQKEMARKNYHTRVMLDQTNSKKGGSPPPPILDKSAVYFGTKLWK